MQTIDAYRRVKLILTAVWAGIRAAVRALVQRIASVWVRRAIVAAHAHAMNVALLVYRVALMGVVLGHGRIVTE